MEGYQYITEVNQLSNLVKDLSSTKELAIDIESNGLDPYTSKLLLLQINTGNEIYVLDCTKLPKKVLVWILSVIEGANITCIGHNLKFDTKLLYHNTGVLLKNLYDTMLAEQLINAGIMFTYPSLALLTLKYFNIVLEKDVRDSFINFSGNITEEQILYSALDVRHLLEIKKIQLGILEEQKQLRVVDLEMNLIHIVMLMEYFGIGFDADKWKEIYEKDLISQKEKEAYFIDLFFNDYFKSDFSRTLDVANELCIPVKTKRLSNMLQSLDVDYGKAWIKENFNINSDKQVLSALRIAGLKIDNTNAKTIDKHMEHPLVKALLDYRTVSKLVSTYGESFIIKNINPITHRIHTDFSQLVSTGRFASSNPNLQNIPTHSDRRGCFKPREGYKFIIADYSQAELRLMGAVSKEHEFINAFMHGEDLHKKSATFIFNKPADEITKDERQKGKMLNFSLIYGVSEYGLFRQFNIPLELGKEYIDKYFQGYPALKVFFDVSARLILKNMFSVTPYGRKRFFSLPKIFTDVYEERSLKSKVIREGRNHIIQGGVADVIKQAMVDLGERNLSLYTILLQVHDELVFEVPIENIEEATKVIEQKMTAAFQPLLKDIPAVVDIHVADEWSK